VPVVLVSGFSLESDLEELKALGITGILKKPYNTDDLAAMIERTIAKRSRSEWSQGLTNSALSALVQDGSHVFATPVDPTDIQARPVE
jgi:DNA-binding NarL/FixJ family response regulator